jgi:AcrR family transcriptional regulator
MTVDALPAPPAKDLRAEASGTSARILDAAFEAVATFGLSRLTVDDVARLAGVSRQTVYRYYESRDALIVALVAREEEILLEGVRVAHRDAPNLREAIRRSVLFCLTAAREHPLLDRLLESEPEVLLPYLTTRAGGLIDRARLVLEELVSERKDVRPELVARSADLAVRAAVSYTLTPTAEPPEQVAREIARILTSGIEKRRKEDSR